MRRSLRRSRDARCRCRAHRHRAARRAGRPPCSETQEGSKSPEGGAYGAGADVNESESRGIVNWWSLDYGPKPKDPTHKDWPPPFGFALINFGIFLGHHVAPGVEAAQAVHAPTATTASPRTSTRRPSCAPGRERRSSSTRRRSAASTARSTRCWRRSSKEAEAEKARIIATAEADAKRLKDDAERQIAAEIDRARRELRRGVIEAAVGAAEDVAARRTSAPTTSARWPRSTWPTSRRAPRPGGRRDHRLARSSLRQGAARDRRRAAAPSTPSARSSTAPPTRCAARPSCASRSRTRSSPSRSAS